jgi:hypothetical protein
VDKHTVVVRIRERMRAGTLPSQDCLVTWFGHGRGRPCAVCDEAIASTDREIACDLPGGGTMVLHEACFDLWHAALPG